LLIAQQFNCVPFISLHRSIETVCSLTMTRIKSNLRLLPGDTVATSIAANMCAFKSVLFIAKSRKEAESKRDVQGVREVSKLRGFAAQHGNLNLQKNAPISCLLSRT
jgi:hypothetical protein